MRNKMCNMCAEALNKYYPHLTNEEQVELLYSATSFPFGDGEYVVKQIEEVRSNTDGSLSQARAYADAMIDKAMENRNENNYGG